MSDEFEVDRPAGFCMACFDTFEHVCCCAKRGVPQRTLAPTPLGSSSDGGLLSERDAAKPAQPTWWQALKATAATRQRDTMKGSGVR